MTDIDERTATLARALWSELDYVLGVDPNTLAVFCVKVLDTFDASQSHSRGTLPASLPTSTSTSEGTRGGLPGGASRVSEPA